MNRKPQSSSFHTRAVAKSSGNSADAPRRAPQATPRGRDDMFRGNRIKPTKPTPIPSRLHCPAETLPPQALEEKIRKIRRALEEMKQYKRLMAAEGISPDRADKERESALIVKLLRLEKSALGKTTRDTDTEQTEKPSSTREQGRHSFSKEKPSSSREPGRRSFSQEKPSSTREQGRRSFSKEKPSPSREQGRRSNPMGRPKRPVRR